METTEPDISDVLPRHRLSRGGDRQLNRALHIAALTQARMPGTEGHGYFRRKLAAGKSRNEALRCLKRRLSDVVYRCMVADAWWPMLAPALPRSLDTEAPPHGAVSRRR